MYGTSDVRDVGEDACLLEASDGEDDEGQRSFIKFKMYKFA